MGSDILGKSDSIVGQSKRVGEGVSPIESSCERVWVENIFWDPIRNTLDPTEFGPDLLSR